MKWHGMGLTLEMIISSTCYCFNNFSGKKAAIVSNTVSESLEPKWRHIVLVVLDKGGV